MLAKQTLEVSRLHSKVCILTTVADVLTPVNETSEA